jgi:hypothetical protein
MEKTGFDTHYFAEGMSTLSDGELAAAAEFLRDTDSRTAATLAFTICGNLPDARADAFRQQLKEAKLPQLRALAE